MNYSVLLDTSFFIRLLNQKDPLQKNAHGYYKYFLEKDVTMKISTISIAEYCVRGKSSDLPYKNLHILPFNMDHAVQAGNFANKLFQDRNITTDQLLPRPIIPNDAKLLSQADKDHYVHYFVTSDSRSQKTVASLKSSTELNFELIDIHNTYGEQFGELPL